MWGHTPQPGDWVRTTTKVPIGIADYLTASGLPAGTSGVVTGRTGRRVTVELDTGYGLATATVDANHLTTTRRQGGRSPFLARTRLRNGARVGLMLFIAWPTIQYIATYLWINHTADGLIESIFLSTLEAAGDFLVASITSPIKALLYIALLTVLSRLAFKR